MHPPDDSQTGGGWLFRHQGLLYGPVPTAVLLEKAQRGEVGPDTPVAREGEPFRRMGDEPVFAVEVARTAARIRVEREAREASRARRRRRIAWAAGLGSAALALVAGVVWLVFWADARGFFSPDEETLAALQIHASLPTIRVELPEQREAEEFDYLLGPEPARRSGASATPAAPARAAAAAKRPERREPGDEPIIAALYDQAAIQAVLAREQRTLFPCLQEVARTDPAFRGNVPLTFTINNDGTVGRIWIDRPGFQKGPLYDCFRQKMASWRFPGFEGERPSVSLNFRVGS